MSGASRTTDSGISRRHQWLGYGTSFTLHLAVVVLVFGLALNAPSLFDGGSSPHIDAIATSTQAAARVDTPHVEIPVDGTQMAESTLQEKVREKLTDAQERSSEENLSELDQRVAQLNQISSPESVDAISEHVGRVMGLQSRATVPAETKPTGTFDPDSAQFHDVKRLTNKDGSFTYTAILVDAAGCQSELELTEDEGQTLYATMQKINANPLLGRIYRSMVMPLVDQLLEEQKTAIPAAVESKR
jgi:hypothetical protein